MATADIVLQIRKGTKNEWEAANPLLESGEIGAELDTGRLKVGNGTQRWLDLAYADGDKRIDGGQYTG